MADNTTTQAEALATVPAGEVFGFDDVDGVKIARSKTGFGVDGSYTDVSAADPLPVVQTGTPALPTGAATSANQDTLIAAVDGVEGLLTTIDADTGSIAASAATIAGAVSGTEMQVDVLTMPTVAVTDNAGSLTVDDGGGSLTVDGTVAVSGTVAVTDNSGSLTVDNAGTFAVQAAQSGTWNITNVSGTVSLPTGAATAAKQPALGTAGTPSADVITVQGVTSMTPLKVDGSAVTQPVSDAGGSLTVDGTVTVQDGGGSLTVDGTVAATQSGPWTVDLGATDNAVLDAIAASLAGTLTVTGGGGGTEYTEGDTDASITGSAILWEDTSDTLRAVSAAKPLPVGDAGGSLTVDDGGSSLTVDGTVAVTGTFWQATQPVSLASVPSHAVTNAGTFAVQDSQKITDNGAFTDGTTKVQPVGFIFDEVAGTALTENDMGAARMDSKRAVVGVLEDATTRGQRAAVSAAGRLSVDASGVAVPITDNSGSITVDNAGTFAVQATLQSGTNGIGKLTANSGVDIGDVDVTSVVPGTGATNLGKAEDAAHSSGDVGVMALAVRKDTATQLAGTDGDYSPLITDANGALHVAVASGSVTASGSIDVLGDTAHDAADSGDPVKVGTKAANALPTAVANGDRANAIGDLFGRVLTSHIDPAMQVTKAVTYTSQQTGSTIWDPTSGKRIAITDVTIASYGTTAGRVILWFGANADTTYSAGTDQVLEAASFAPSSNVKPGMAKSYTVPVFCTTADHELHITTDAAMSVDVTVRGYEW